MTDLPSSLGIEAVELLGLALPSWSAQNSSSCSTAHNAAKARAGATSIRADAYARIPDFA